jgi:Na+/H+-dicarboxylate symporter
VTIGEPPASRIPSLTTQILAGLVLGAVVGVVWPHAGVASKPLADAFLRLIKMIIAPLVFRRWWRASRARRSQGDGPRRLKAIIYFEVATTIAPSSASCS